MGVALLWRVLRRDLLSPVFGRARTSSSRVYHEIGVTDNIESLVTIGRLASK